MRNTTENQIELLFIRHGKTRANQEKRYLGKTEEELSQQGRTELEQRVYPPVKSLFGSPMQRCRQTAELLYPNLPYRSIPEWREMDFGRFEGKNYEDLKEDADYQRWIDSNGTLPFPEGESREAFIRRCGRGLRRLLEIMVCQGSEANISAAEDIPGAVNVPLSENIQGAANAPLLEKIPGAANVPLSENIPGAANAALSEKISAAADTPVAAIVHGGTIMALLSHYGGEKDYFDYQCKNGEGYRCTVKFSTGEDGKLLEDSIRIEKITELFDRVTAGKGTALRLSIPHRRKESP